LTEAHRISALRIFADQFKSLVIRILIGAGVLGEGVEAIAILAVVVFNAVIGFYQEFNAEKSIAALKMMTAPQAKVRRDGKVVSIPAAELVAADARLMKAAALTCIEAELTGESEAVSKQAVTLTEADIPIGDRENMIFMGTSVAAGTGQAVIVATAMKMELGHIAGLLEQAGADESTPLERKLESFGPVLV